MANGSNNAEHKSLTNTLNMNRLFFFLKQKNRGYIQKRPTIYRPIQKRKCVYKMCGETRTFHLCFGEGYHTTFSQLKMDWYKCLYINFKSFFHVQNHPGLPRLTGSPVAFFLFHTPNKAT